MAARAPEKRPTIRDVARVARVSHQTVSRVINGENSLAAATRARVERVIARLGAEPRGAQPGQPADEDRRPGHG